MTTLVGKRFVAEVPDIRVILLIEDIVFDRRYRIDGKENEYR